MNEFANVLAVTILADGEFDTQENELLQDLESDAELPGLAEAVRQVISASSDLTDEQLTDLLYNSASKIHDADKPKVFEAAITTMMADGVITHDEISNLLTLAEALEIPTEKAIARLLFQVQETEGQLVVDVEDDLEDFIMVGGRMRFTSWQSFEKMLNEKQYPANLTDVLHHLNDWCHSHFGSKAEVNFTPNFLTLSCTNPVSRSKTFCFARMRKSDIRLEFNGLTHELHSADELNATIQAEITAYFNEISKEKA
jgi:hypothetical protein